MAKKKKRTAQSRKETALPLRVGGNFGEKTGTSPEAKAREAMRSALEGKFRAFHFIVEANEGLLKHPFYRLEVDTHGQPSESSYALLKQQAEKILSCNFQPRDKAGDGLTWGTAYWTSASGLDPYVGFEVGLCRSRRPNKDRQRRTLEVLTTAVKLDGLGIEPDSEGNHLDIPGFEILEKNLVVVSRNGFDLETCSLLAALRKLRIKEWSEKSAAEEEAAKAAKAARTAEAAKAAKAKAAEAAGVFLSVLNDIAAEEAAKAEAREREEYAGAIKDLDDEWTRLCDPLDVAWSESREKVNLVHGLVRPDIPQREAVVAFAGTYGKEQVLALADWVESTHAARKDMRLDECVSLAVQAEVLGDLVDPQWWENGTPLDSLGALDEYKTLSDLRAAIKRFPGAQEQLGKFLGSLEAKIREGRGDQKTTP